MAKKSLISNVLSSLDEKRKQLFSAQQQAITSFREQLDQIEDAIIAAKNKLHDVERAPIPLEDVEKRIDAYLNFAENRARQSFIPAAMSKPGSSVDDSGLFNMLRSTDPMVALGTLLILGQHDAIKSALVSEALAAAGATEPLADAEREAQVSDLKEEIQSLETALEECARAAEANGLRVPRREDASPAALLAP